MASIASAVDRFLALSADAPDDEIERAYHAAVDEVEEKHAARRHWLRA